MNQPTTISIDVAVNDAAVCANVTDARGTTLALFHDLTPAQQESLAADAWLVGVRALTNAYQHAQESRLEDLGEALLADVEKQLTTHVERHQAQLVHVLQRYFDPQDGQVAQRIDAFVRDGGELSRQLERYFAPGSGAVARTLAQQLGESSPLLRRLSPTDSEGVVCLLERKIDEVLQRNQQSVALALDPHAEDGPVARLFRTLRTEMSQAEKDRTRQLELATKALDANDESSLLSRLMRETSAARTSLLRAFNADEPGSPLFVLRSSLAQLLDHHAKTQEESLARFDERQRKLDQDIRASLVRLEERKRELARSTHGGFEFEDAVLLFVQRAVQGAALVAEPTGRSVGACRGSKVGDMVLRFTAESPFEGASIVVEAKRDLGYTETKALRELGEARANRTATVGLFVMARSHAPTGFPNFVRRGNDVVVTWDPDDATTNPYLLAALFLTTAMVTRQRRDVDDADRRALCDIEDRIHGEIARHDKMKKLAESIRKHAEDLHDELRRGGDKLDLLLRKAKKTLKALDLEVDRDDQDVTPRLNGAWGSAPDSDDDVAAA